MNSFLIIVNFLIIAIASKQIGQYFAKVLLPMISGFLFSASDEANVKIWYYDLANSVKIHYEQWRNFAPATKYVQNGGIILYRIVGKTQLLSQST